MTVSAITTPDDQQHGVIAGSVRSYKGDVDLAVLKFRSSKSYKLAELGDSNILEGGMDLYFADVSGGLGVETGKAVARTVQNLTLTADDYFASAN